MLPVKTRPKPRCKRCATAYVRELHQLGALDRALSTMHLYPFRCQLCAYRFWARGNGHRNRFVNNDKREYARFAIYLPVMFSGEQDIGEGRIRTLSIRGCTMESAVRLPHGVVLSLTLRPDDSLPPIEVEAATVRSALGRRFGLEFVRIDAVEEDRLRNYIESLIATRPGELKKILTL